jgi:hypothetical protein
LGSCKNPIKSPQTINHSTFEVKKEIEPSELGKYAQQVTEILKNKVHGNINIEGKLVLVPLSRKMLKTLKLSWNGTE